MKTKIICVLPVLFLAACLVSGHDNDLLDPAIGKSTLRDPGNGTITDSATGLVWKKCSQGQTADSSCSGTAGLFQFCSASTNACNGGGGGGNTGTLDGVGTSAAYTSCNTLNTVPDGGFAGKTTWRVPTLSELRTINVRSETDENVFKIFFPNTPRNDYYVSANSYNSSEASVTTYLGYDYHEPKTTPYLLRCVAQ